MATPWTGGGAAWQRPVGAGRGAGRHGRAPSLQPRPSRRAVVVQAAEAPKLLPVLATAAALGATAVTVRHVLMQRQRQQQQQQQQGSRAERRQRHEREGCGSELPSGSSSGGSRSAAGSWAAALASRQVQGLSFGWPLQSKEQKKERQLLTTLQEIEQRQFREEQQALRHFDMRLGLRTKTLSELRAMAQQHNIAGRSRMRKRELVAALEAMLGFASPPPQPQPQPRRHLH